MRIRLRGLALAAAAALLPGSACDQDVGDGDQFGVHTVRVSVTAAGGQVGTRSFNPSISGDGLLVAFESDADDLVANDANELRDVFVKNRATGMVERVSIDLPLPPGESFGGAFNASISRNGRYVTFEVSEQAFPRTVVYVRDRLLGTTTRAIELFIAPNAGMLKPVVSDVGPVVAFTYSGDDIPITAGAWASGSVRQILLVDLTGGPAAQAVLLSRASGSPSTAAGGLCDQPSISADGSTVVFRSYADNLLPAADSNLAGIYLSTRSGVPPIGDPVSIVSVDPATGSSPSLDFCDDPDISAGGRYVAFTVIDPNFTSSYYNVAVRDRTAGTSTVVSTDAAGSPVTRRCDSPRVSDDGQFVVFAQWDALIFPPAANEVPQIMLRDRSQPTFFPISVNRSGALADARCSPSLPALSADGRWAVYGTPAGNLVADDTNGAGDIFVRGPFR